jgi:hypothetical protein
MDDRFAPAAPLYVPVPQAGSVLEYSPPDDTSVALPAVRSVSVVPRDEPVPQVDSAL